MRASGDDQPDFVAVPHRADRVEHRPPVALVTAQERQQGPHAEIEALEQEVGAPEDRDEDKPDLREAHVDAPTGTSGGSTRA